jgi:predicted membrane protein
MSMDITPGPARPRVTPQVVLGLLVIALGVVFTLANLGLIDADQYLSYWPAALVAVGLLKLWQSRDGHGIIGGLFLVVVGGWMLLERIAVIRVNIRDVWPLFFVFLGGYLVFKGLGGAMRRTRPADSSAHVTALAIMAGVERRSSSTAFEGGDLTAIMGGCEIDLRRASISADEAVIDVFAFWGGIELRVPETWQVVGHVTPLMGGYEDKTSQVPQSGSAKRLVIRGIVVMGGVTVKN